MTEDVPVPRDPADDDTAPLPRLPAWRVPDERSPQARRPQDNATGPVPPRATPAPADPAPPANPAVRARTRSRAAAPPRPPGHAAGRARPQAARRTHATPERSQERHGAGSDTGPDTGAHDEPGPGDAGHVREHGHGHGHGHGPVAPASRRVRLLLAATLIPIAVATLVGVVLLYPWGGNPAGTRSVTGIPVHGEVTSVAVGPCLAAGQVQVGTPDEGADDCLGVDVRLTDGDGAGGTIHKVLPIEPGTPRFAAGDAVVLSYSGANPHDPVSYQIRDFQRGTPLLVLAGLFAVAVVLLGRLRGLAALVALGLSFAVLALFVLPAILAGEDPLLVAICGSGLVMFVALYLTHGFSARTSVAVLGTLVSLALIGVISAIFSSFARLTGLDDDTTTLIAALGHGIDARGLLLAGVVIGALGVLDDVTVTQASAVWELRRANPALSRRQLYGAALRIGRDHVGSAVNTLVLAYAGAALPLLLLASLSGAGLGSVLGSSDIAEEIVRTLAGSVGIVAAVPVTTLLAAMIAVREDVPPGDAITHRSTQ